MYGIWLYTNAFIHSSRNCLHCIKASRERMFWVGSLITDVEHVERNARTNANVSRLNGETHKPAHTHIANYWRKKQNVETLNETHRNIWIFHGITDKTRFTSAPPQTISYRKKKCHAVLHKNKTKYKHTHTHTCFQCSQHRRTFGQVNIHTSGLRAASNEQPARTHTHTQILSLVVGHDCTHDVGRWWG